MKLIKIALDNIHQNENSRMHPRKEGIADLMGSMKQEGLLQPIGVREIKGEQGQYEIVFGNRRFTAAKKLGWDEIHAVNLDKEGDEDFLITNLVENLQRENLDAIDEGRYFTILRDKGYTVSEIAAKLNIGVGRVKASLHCFQTVPSKYQSYISNSIKGRKKGRIRAATASKIMSFAASNGLRNPEVEKLMEFARQDMIGSEQISAVSALMGKGATIEEAIETSSRFKRVNVVVLVDKDRAARLERKYKKQLGVILHDYLASNPEFKIFTWHKVNRAKNTSDPIEAEVAA